MPGLFDIPGDCHSAGFLVAALVGMPSSAASSSSRMAGRWRRLATWGISLILQQAVRTAFGPTNREVGAPTSCRAPSSSAAHHHLNRLIIVFAGLRRRAAGGPALYRARPANACRHPEPAYGSRHGHQHRPHRRADLRAVGTPAAGVALSQIDNVSPNLARATSSTASWWWCLAASATCGGRWSARCRWAGQQVLEPYAGAVLGKILLLVLVILFIQKRPRGLFALKGRAVEA